VLSIFQAIHPIICSNCSKCFRMISLLQAIRSHAELKLRWDESFLPFSSLSCLFSLSSKFYLFQAESLYY
jgi:hypothetical protein